MDAFFKDVKHSIHLFLKSPGFTITAVAALALGIGATTAIFSVVDTVLPVPDADRQVLLLSVGVSDNGATDVGAVASPAKFEFWRGQSSVIQDVSAFNAVVMNYTGGEVVEQLHSMQASADFFRCFGSPPGASSFSLRCSPRSICVAGSTPSLNSLSAASDGGFAPSSPAICWC
jgi:hypothetical protein